MVPNSIEKQVLLDASRVGVWSALTEGQHVGNWFGDRRPARIDLRVGGMMVFDHRGHGDLPAQIEVLTPTSHLAFRWAVIGPAGELPSSTNSTVVSIMLEEHVKCTKVRLTETGFQSVDATPAELEARYKANDVGWDRTLGDLARYVRVMSRS